MRDGEIDKDIRHVPLQFRMTHDATCCIRIAIDTQTSILYTHTRKKQVLISSS
jgi:hypothetical protein